MNKTFQVKNNTYINYWTEQGLASKKANQEQKVKDSNNPHYMLRHPVLDELTFATPVKKELAKKAPKSERYEKLPFSHKHNLLVAQAYGKENRLLKHNNHAIFNCLLDFPV